MNHHCKSGFLLLVFLAALVAGCGDAVLPEENAPSEVKWIFGEIDLPAGDRLRFRVSIDKEGPPHQFEQTLSTRPARYLSADIDWNVKYLEIGEDSVFFDVSSEGRRPVSFRARNSADLYIGFTRAEDSGEDSTYHWEGSGCRGLSGSGEPPHISPDELAYPLRYELPSYPDTLVAQGREGTVKVRVRVGRCGNTIRTSIVRSVQDDLDSLAIQAVRNWEFYPARVGRTYVGIDEIISLVFTASGGAGGGVEIRVGS